MDVGMSERERALELIHAEVDGELDGPAKAELSRRLLADPSLRALRDQVRATCAAIDALPSEEPPEGLRASIMEMLPASPPVCGDRAARSVGFRAGRPLLRYAAAFAGGLLVSALAFQFAWRDARVDPRELSGTIAGVTADASKVELHLDEVSGTVRVEGPDSAPVVVAELTAQRPVQVIARLDGEEVRITGFGALQQELRPVRTAFVRRNANAVPARVEVSVVDAASGVVLQTTVLRPSVAPDEK
jgi:anti-sigma factor RsiW